MATKQRTKMNPTARIAAVTAFVAAVGGLVGAGTGLFTNVREACAALKIFPHRSHTDTLAPLSKDSSNAEFQKWLLAANEGDVKAKHQIVDAYTSGYGVEKDFGKGFALLTELAEKGDSEAQILVGKTYRDGLGVTPDYQKAVFWFNQAIKQGSADAEDNMAKLYLTDSPGFDQNIETALFWEKRAAAHGDLGGLVGMCGIYHDGILTQRDDRLALPNCRAAQAQGSDWAGSIADEIENAQNSPAAR